MGPIIPPSILMVLMGVTTGLSIGGLFAAGIVPGLLLGLSMMALSLFMAVRYQYPREVFPFTGRIFWRFFAAALPALFAPLIILGGILGGVFTPTEAAAVAVFYAFFLGMCIYRELDLKELKDILVRSGVTTAVLLLIIGMANIFSWVLSAEQIPTRIAEGMLAVTENPYLILLFINIFLIFIGTFLEGGAAIIILAPTLLSVAQTVGIDPLHFGLVMVLNIAVGLLTPPLGVCLFVVSGVTGLQLSTIIRSVLPFLALELAVLLLATYWPGIILFVPKMLGYI
jgi:C4-dicarboxylate transporter DctM subunit